MRSFGSIVASASLFAAGALAGGHCMSDAAAQQVATNFGDLIENYSKSLAQAALTPDFHDYSDSVIELINSGCTTPDTLGSATFTSRAAFEKGQGSQPGIPFQQLNLWHTCDTVMLRWRTTISSTAPEEVTGIIVLETVPAPAGNKYPWQIETVYSEFNSGAWLVDLGVFTPSCNSSSKRDTEIRSPVRML